ncbi:MAG: hypothetical protein LBS16_04820 [Prevotellaceae bacterium]|nr:hypothetical protein [Prevotellaceae bacterium]
MKTNQFIFAAFTAAFLSVASFSAAQVTIGGSDAPKAGAILDLNSSVKGGLQLSNVSITDLGKIPVGTNLFPGITAGGVGDANDDVNAKLTGAIVYNTNTSQLYVSLQKSIDMWGKGIYVWDGNQWNKIGKPAYSITFAPYNLGADVATLNANYPGLSPAKQQMKYLVDYATSSTDATVFGDLYQWGRIADGHEKRTSSTKAGPIGSTAVDVNGQPKDAASGKGLFIKNASSPHDWSNPQNTTRWGNGQLVNYNFGSADGGAVPNGSGSFYQKPVKTINDPCPDGWRIPTQDEWERLVTYDGNPSVVGGDFSGIVAAGTSPFTTNSAPLTWVPVKGGKASASDWSSGKGTVGGHAIYKTSDWTDAADGYKNGTLELFTPAAPEPILFLPVGGYRTDSGAHTDTFVRGHYWSSTVNAPNSWRLSCRATSVSLTYDGCPRGYGLSVRCVK